MEREILETLINKGLSQRKIATELNCSQATVKWWLSKYSLHTKVKHKVGTAKYEIMNCRYHGTTRFIFQESSKRYRCRACRSGRVNDARRKIKQRLVIEAGGHCIKCGYNKSIWALEFDHREPKDKRFSIGLLIKNRKLDLALEEIKKCDLLCANCHSEKHHNEWIENTGSVAVTVQALV